MTPSPHHYIYAAVSPEEHARVQALAAKAGLTVSNYVRRAVNCLLLEEDPWAEPLEERHWGAEERHGQTPR